MEIKLHPKEKIVSSVTHTRLVLPYFTVSENIHDIK